MTETHWLLSSDPEEMYFRVVKPLKSGRRRMDLFCLACVRPLLHLLEDADAKRPFEWLEEHAGERSRPASRGHVRELFQGPAIKLYQAHHRREPGVGGFAVHVAYDLWADWYEYAFPNFSELHAHYPDALHENPRTYLSVIMRDIFGNPFRPTYLDPAWLTPTVTRLAESIYEDGAFDRLPILADALEDAGCTDATILNHCRGPGTHVLGCWVVDALLGKS